VARGGVRPGAGRKPGEATKRTQELVKKALDIGITPLEIMVTMMKRAWDAGDEDKAFLYAKDAAPYMHAKLAAVDSTVKADVVQKVLSADPLTEDEWAKTYAGSDLAATEGATEGTH
jgi:hypothetical protein